MKGATFNQLTIFHAIAREGSIRGAARKLEVAPPSVSQALKQLEAQVGLPLFSRTTRRIELTEAGHLLHERTAEAISSLDFALESVQNLGERPSGKVTITVPRFVYQFFLRPIYAEFCRLYPELELEISVSDKAEDILREGYDMGIRFGDRIEAGMVARPLTPPMRDAVFASESYLNEFGLPKCPEDLHVHKLIRYRFIASHQLAPLELHQKGQTFTVDMPSSLIVNDTDLMIDAAEKGLGIGRLVTPAVADKLSDGSLKPVLEKYWHPMPGLHLYFLQNSQKARRIRVLIDFLVEKGQSLNPHDPAFRRP